MSPKNIEQLSKDKDAEMATMVFKAKKIQFFPSDLQKMEGMSREEKMDYVKKLREEHRYIDFEEFDEK